MLRARRCGRCQKRFVPSTAMQRYCRDERCARERQREQMRRFHVEHPHYMRDWRRRRREIERQEDRCGSGT